jgi:acyl-CoA dehydrogenase
MAMDLALVQEAIQGITKRFDRPYWLKCAREGRATHELWRAMAEAGLLGVGIPEAYGGFGGGVRETAALMEALSQAGMPPLFLVITGLSRTAILRHGSEAQKQAYIPPTVTGEKKFCFAITEPNAGTNTFKIQTLARQSINNTYLLNGQKIFISGANEADYMLVVARTTSFKEVSDRREGLSLFIVDAKSKGIELQPLNIAITAPEKQFIVFFSDVEVPAENLLGEEGHGIRYLFDALNPERLLAAATCVGIGDYALRKAVAYARERAPFDKPIGSYQALQHPLAYAKAHLEAARLMLYHACDVYDQGGVAGPESNMVKLLASEAAVEACNLAIQVHGGYGFDTDYDIITLWPLARLMEVAPLNNQMILNYIGEHVLGLPKSY